MESVKKMMDRQEIIDSTIDFNKRRIDEHDFLLYKFQKRTDMEAEYEFRISKVETDVKEKLGKMNSLMSDLKTNVKVADSKSQANNLQIDLMNSRLDAYLSRLKEDVGKISNKNEKLFEQFMDRTRDVDSKY
jgi:hypothetical protein